MTMDHTRKFDLRLVWAAMAAVLAGAAIWAGTALAADGSSSSTDSNSTGNTPAQSVQNEGSDQAPVRNDCPEPGSGGGSGSGSGGSEGNSGGYPAEGVSPAV
jgi:hypothetical protein